VYTIYMIDILSTDIFIGIIVFLFGTIIGSFLNVVIFRYGSGTSSVRSRSRCLSCGKTLSWKELFPLLSFLILRGKCRHCGIHISTQYPLVEFLTGALFTIVYILVSPHLAYGLPQFPFLIGDVLFLWAITALLIVILVYDMRHMIIPDMFAYGFAGLALAYTFLPVLYFGWQAVSYGDLLAGPVFASAFALVWLLSKGTWMGLGDAKLVLGMGILLGFRGGFSALLLAFWSGALWGLTAIALQRYAHMLQLSGKQKQFTMKSEVPFGPFLIAGLFAVLLFRFDILSLLI